MKKSIILFVMFVLFAGCVCAAGFETEVTLVKDTIKLNEAAQFLVTIKSNSSSIEEFKIYSPDVEWNVPLKTIKIDPNSSASEKIEINPTKYIKPGLYGVHINVMQIATEELAEKTVLITVLSSEKEEYAPSVSMEADMVRQVEPGKPFAIRVNLENQNILNLTGLSLIVSSDLATLSRQQDVELNSLDKKVIDLSYSIDPQQQPKAYQVSFALMQGNETIASTESKTIEVVSTTPKFKSSFEEKKSFFKTVTDITYTNDGNVRNTQTVKVPTSWFASIFTKTDPASVIVKEDNQRYLTWSIELGPSETRTVSVTTNYRALLAVIIIIIIILLVYAKYRKRVIVRKGIANVSTEEGGISQMKIMLDVINGTGKGLKEIKIIDIVPTIADIKKEFPEGTLKPSSILRHSSKGILLKWEIPELAPGEERLISYDIRTKLSILGSFTLPRAKVKYIKDGKEGIVISNSTGVSP